MLRHTTDTHSNADADTQLTFILHKITKKIMEVKKGLSPF